MARVDDKKLEIDILDEIEELDGTTLEIFGKVVHQKKRTQSTCSLKNNTLVYTPNKMRDEEVNTHLTTLAVYKLPGRAKFNQDIDQLPDPNSAPQFRTGNSQRG